MYSYREYYEMVRSYILSGESLNGAQRLYEAESIPRLFVYYCVMKLINELRRRVGARVGPARVRTARQFPET